MLNKRQLFTTAAGVAALTGAGIGIARAQDARQGLSAASAVEDIKKRGVLRVGVSTFIPWAFRNKAGELSGYDIDVGKRLAEDMGVKPEFVPTAWDGIIPALIAGRFDYIMSMTITPARNLQVNFTNPYTITGVDVVANKQLAGNLKTVEDFNKPNVTIVARRASSAGVATQRFFSRATIRQFDDDAQALLEVVNGRAHAWVSTVPKPAFAAVDNPNVVFQPFTDLLARQADCMAIRKGDPDWLNFLNNWILLRQMDGWLEEKQAFWFKNRTWKDDVNQ